MIIGIYTKFSYHALGSIYMMKLDRHFVCFIVIFSVLKFTCLGEILSILIFIVFVLKTNAVLEVWGEVD